MWKFYGHFLAPATNRQRYQNSWQTTMTTTETLMASLVAGHRHRFHTISPIAVARWTYRTNVCAIVRCTRCLIVPLITCMRATRAYRISCTLWNVRQVAGIMCRAVKKRTFPICVRWAKCIHITTLLHKFSFLLTFSHYYFAHTFSTSTHSHTRVFPVALCSCRKKCVFLN